MMSEKIKCESTMGILSEGKTDQTKMPKSRRRPSLCSCSSQREIWLERQKERNRGIEREGERDRERERKRKREVFRENGRQRDETAERMRERRESKRSLKKTKRARKKKSYILEVTSCELFGAESR